MKQIRTKSIVLAAGLALGLGGVASAQNALDKNLQQGSGGVNPTKRTLSEDLRFRNAIVTGNAPGGMSFRGDVGYRAPGEFAGSLPSNDQFAFRRDSVGSGLGGMGIRGTDAIQYQFGAATGARSAQSGLGSLLVDRNGTAPSAGDIRQADQRGVPRLPVIGGPGHTLEDDTPALQETRGLSLLSLRSPSAYTANRGFVPAVIGTSQTASGESWALTASPLRGVVYRPMSMDEPGASIQGARTDGKPEARAGEIAPTKLSGESASTAIDDRAKTAIDARAGMGAIESRIDERLGATIKPLEVKPSEAKANEPGGVEAKPGALPGQPGAKGADASSSVGVKSWRDRLADLRKDLSDDVRDQPIRPRAPLSDAKAKQDDLKGDAKGEGDTGDGKTDERVARRGVAKESKELVRSAAGEPIQRYAPQGFDAYAENMARAQEHMAAGRYFDAEQRFVAAGSAKGGDAMAAIGRVNSQIGAGTFTSAALSLRSVLAGHPEIIAARYDAKIMPTAQRLTNASERLRELIARDRAGARDPALVLAYIGYQTKNAAMTREGLDALDASLGAGQPGGIAPDDASSRLAELLRDVWLNPAAISDPAK
jgi:hypothetical protein